MQFTQSAFFKGFSLNFIKLTPQMGSFFFRVLWRKWEATTSPPGPAFTLNFLMNLSCLTREACERSSRRAESKFELNVILRKIKKVAKAARARNDLERPIKRLGILQNMKGWICLKFL